MRSDFTVTEKQFHNCFPHIGLFPLSVLSSKKFRENAEKPVTK